jgi:hypothetical protein
MALTKLNARSIPAGAVSADSLADGSITTDKIADGAVHTDKIADQAITHSKTNIIGSFLWMYDNNVQGQTANGWMQMADTVNLPSTDVLEESFGNMISVTFFSYISSGSYYYTWRVYDVTAGNVVLPVRPNEYDWYGNSNGTGGGFRFEGNVHQASQQAARCFDLTGRGGNTLRLEASASNGTGDYVYTNGSQTLYADQIFWYGGYMSGMHNENGF